LKIPCASSILLQITFPLLQNRILPLLCLGSWSQSVLWWSQYVAAIKIKVMMGWIWHNRSRHGWSLIETSIFTVSTQRTARRPLFHEPLPANFTALGIIAAAGPCPDISGHIKTVFMWKVSCARSVLTSNTTCRKRL